MLRLLKRHFKGIAVGLAVFLISQILRSPSRFGVLGQLVGIARDAGVSIVIGLAVDLWTLRMQIGVLRKCRDSLAVEVRDEIEPYILEQLRAASRGCINLTGDPGVVMSAELLQEVVAGCYVGHRLSHLVVVHSLPMSEFARVFSMYRDQQFWEERIENPGQDVRVIVGMKEALRTDSTNVNSAGGCWGFYEQNRSHKMLMLQIEPERADEALRRLPARNLWLFGREFAIFWEPVSAAAARTSQEFRVFLRYCDNALVKELRAALSSLADHASELVDQDTILSCNGPNPERREVLRRRLLAGLPL